MADEKVMVSTNALNAAFKKQLEKRANAPIVSDEAAASHVATLVAPTVAVGGLDTFCGAWRAYYPRIVSLLGWASWVLPPATINVIKGLLAVINSQLIPMICQPPVR